MIILGIDPGTAIVGFGIIEVENRTFQVLDYGCITTEKTLSPATRLSQIRKDLEELIEEWKPTHAAVEKLFFSKNVKTAMAVSQSRGVIMQKLEEKNIPTSEYTPHEVKINVCGDGKADKKAVQKMIKLLLNLQTIPQPDDAADALAIAVCHAQHLPLLELSQQLR